MSVISKTFTNMSFTNMNTGLQLPVKSISYNLDTDVMGVSLANDVGDMYTNIKNIQSFCITSNEVSLFLYIQNKYKISFETITPFQPRNSFQFENSCVSSMPTFSREQKDLETFISRLCIS